MSFAYDLKRVYALVTTTLSYIYNKVYTYGNLTTIDPHLSNSLDYYIDKFCGVLQSVMDKYNVRVNVAQIIGTTYPELGAYIQSLEDWEFIVVIRTVLEENVWLLYSPEVLRMLLHLSRS